MHNDPHQRSLWKSITVQMNKTSKYDHLILCIYQFGDTDDKSISTAVDLTVYVYKSHVGWSIYLYILLYSIHNWLRWDRNLIVLLQCLIFI